MQNTLYYYISLLFSEIFYQKMQKKIIINMRATIHFDSVIAPVKHAKILPCLHELLSKKVFFSHVYMGL